jgi:hypothetical protein
MKSSQLVYLPLLLLVVVLPGPSDAQTTSNPANFSQRDGSHDFDFLIANWKAHVRRLPDRLNNSTVWVEYDGISNHKKLLDSNANFEEFDVTSTDKKLRIKAHSASTTPHRISGVSIWSMWIMELLACLLSLASLPAIAASFLIRKTSKVGPFSCVTFGSTSLPTRRGWSSHFHLMVGRPGN